MLSTAGLAAAAGTSVGADVAVGAGVSVGVGWGEATSAAAAGSGVAVAASCAAVSGGVSVCLPSPFAVSPPTPISMAASCSEDSAVAGVTEGEPETTGICVGALSTALNPGRGKFSRPAPSAAAVANRIVTAASRRSMVQGDRRWSRGTTPEIGKPEVAGRGGEI